MTDSSASPCLLWLRRDLRLADNPALHDALSLGGPVIPVYILDGQTAALGAAHRWRIGRSLAALEASLDKLGARLILRRGEALKTLRELASETGARAIRWNRLHTAEARARDAEIKSVLGDEGLDVRSHNGSLLHEPWTVSTKEGGHYKVYTPYWRAVAEREIHEPVSAPSKWPSPEAWPDSLPLESLAMDAGMNRGAAVLERYDAAGEEAARERLETFLGEQAQDYARLRDRPDREVTSGLSVHLTTGEISPRQIWIAAEARRREAGKGEAKAIRKFQMELVWREFAYHLLHHAPDIGVANWRSEWDGFPWRGDNEDAEAWRRGRTGVDMVDAGMRELFVTGRMHNRVRMLVASYLTKHLLTDWRVGEAWFRDTLTDWDPASNALGWQWVAGSGPDAAPYFRIFNPETQAEKFDPDGAYRRRWLAELSDDPGDDALAFFDAIPRSWGLKPDDPRPDPLIDLKRGRERALEAYESLKAAREDQDAA